MSLTQDFERIQAHSSAVLGQDTQLADPLRNRLKEIIEGAYLPNTQQVGNITRITVPRVYEHSGRIALLPVQAPGKIIMDIEDMMGPSAIASSASLQRQLLRQSRMVKGKEDPLMGVMPGDAFGITFFPQFESQPIAYAGSLLVAVRTGRPIGQLASTTSHEVTHVNLGHNDPNWHIRSKDMGLDARLRALEEVECYAVQHVLAPLTEDDAARIENAVGSWRDKAGVEVVSQVDVSRFYYATKKVQA